MSFSHIFPTAYHQLTKREQKMTFFVVFTLFILGMDQLIQYAQQEISYQDTKISQQKEVYSSQEEISEILKKQYLDAEKSLELSQHLNSEEELALLEKDINLKIRRMAAAHHLNAVVQKILNHSTELSLEKLNSLKPLPLRSNDVSKIQSAPNETNNTGQDESRAEEEEPSIQSEPYSDIIQNGLQVSLTGKYLTILQFIKHIEQIDEQIFWNKFEYKVSKHPHAQVFLDIYSLSINKEVYQFEQTY
tara:strand:- start:3390 stop:4130 length:741 start_codon:yes stop_codon:yes gene_type:complete